MLAKWSAEKLGSRSIMFEDIDEDAKRRERRLEKERCKDVDLYDSRISGNRIGIRPDPGNSQKPSDWDKSYDRGIH